MYNICKQIAQMTTTFNVNTNEMLRIFDPSDHKFICRCTKKNPQAHKKKNNIKN